MSPRAVTPPSPGIRSFMRYPFFVAAIYDKLASSLAARRVVGSLLGDDNVVWMALAQARAGHADEARVALHLFDGGGADVTHRLAQPADELIDHIRQGPLIRHAPLDAL